MFEGHYDFTAIWTFMHLSLICLFAFYYDAGSWYFNSRAAIGTKFGFRRYLLSTLFTKWHFIHL